MNIRGNHGLCFKKTYNIFRFKKLSGSCIRIVLSEDTKTDLETFQGNMESFDKDIVDKKVNTEITSNANIDKKRDLSMGTMFIWSYPYPLHVIRDNEFYRSGIKSWVNVCTLTKKICIKPRADSVPSLSTTHPHSTKVTSISLFMFYVTIWRLMFSRKHFSRMPPTHSVVK